MGPSLPRVGQRGPWRTRPRRHRPGGSPGGLRHHPGGPGALVRDRGARLSRGNVPAHFGAARRVWPWLGWGAASCWPSCCSCPSWRPSGRGTHRRRRTHWRGQTPGDQFLGLHQLIAARATWRRPEGLGLGFVAPALALLAFVLRPRPRGRCDCAGEADRRACAGTPLGRSWCWCSCLRPVRAALACAAVPVPHGHAAVAAAPACGAGLAWLAGLGADRLVASLGGRPASRRTDLSPCSPPALAVMLVLGVLPDLRPATVSGPPPAAPLAIYGDNEIALLSAEVVGDPGPGGRMAVEVQWQALRPLDRDYTVFFHVIGPDGQRYAQQDGMPDGGQSPTSGWLPGDIVADRYEAALSMDAPIGGALSLLDRPVRRRDGRPAEHGRRRQAGAGAVRRWRETYGQAGQGSFVCGECPRVGADCPGRPVRPGEPLSRPPPARLLLGRAHDARHDVYFIYQYGLSFQEGILAALVARLGLRLRLPVLHHLCAAGHLRGRPLQSSWPASRTRRAQGRACPVGARLRPGACTGSSARGWGGGPGWWPRSRT